MPRHDRKLFVGGALSRRLFVSLLVLLSGALSCGSPPPPFAVPEPDLSAAREVGRERLVAARAEAEAAWAEAPDARARAAAAGRLAVLYHAAKFRGPALAAYEAAESQDPEAFRWVYLRGIVLVEESRLPEAREAFERALELDPGSFPAWIRLGDATLEGGDPAAARAAYERALAVRPGHPAATFGIGRAAVEEGRWEEAVTAFRAVLDREPGAGLARYRLAQALQALEETAEAEALLAQGAEGGVPFDDPIEREVRELAREGAVDVLIAMAREPGERTDEELVGFAVSQFGDVDAAVERLRSAAGPDAETPPEARARLLYVLGSLLVRRREAPEAAEHLREALRLDPSLAAARRRLAELRDAGDRSAQETRLREALDADPADAGARSALAALLGRDGRFDEAATEYRRLVEARPTDEAARMGEATALILGERHARAAERLEAGAAALPDSAQILSALARHLAASPDASVRRGDRAVEVARRALAVAPRLENAETLGMALAEAGRFADAVATQRELLSQAEAAGAQSPVLERLRQNLRRYEAGETCCG